MIASQVTDNDDDNGGSSSDGGQVDVNVADSILQIIDDMEEDDGERLSTGSLSSVDGDSGGNSDRSRHTVICTKMTCDDDTKNRLKNVKNNNSAADTTMSPPPDVIMHHNSIKQKNSKRNGYRRQSFAGLLPLSVMPIVAGDHTENGDQTTTPDRLTRWQTSDNRVPETPGIPSNRVDCTADSDLIGTITATTNDCTSIHVAGKDDCDQSTTTLQTQQVGQ